MSISCAESIKCELNLRPDEILLFCVSIELQDDTAAVEEVWKNVTSDIKFWEKKMFVQDNKPSKGFL